MDSVRKKYVLLNMHSDDSFLNMRNTFKGAAY